MVNPATRLIAALVIGFLIASIACSGENSETSIPNEAAPPATTSVLEGVEIVETIPPTAEGEEPEPLNSEGPRRGGVLASPVFSCGIADPAIDGAAEWLMVDDPIIVTEIHAGLFKLSDDPNAPVQLELAASYEVQEQGLLYEFVLRQDLKFSDGSALTAGDFKWSWERALRKSLPGGRARDVFGSVEGAEAVAERISDDLIGVTVVDDRTIEVRLTQARAEFIALLADPVASVLKKDNVESWPVKWENPGGLIEVYGFDETNMPVGAGPFKLIDYFVRFAPGKDRCVISRNPHYWGRPAYLDGVWFRPEVMKHETESLGGEVAHKISSEPRAFVNEETDYESTPCYFDSVPAEDEDFIEVDGARESSKNRAPTISFIVLNAAAPPFDDPDFRRAVVASADTDSFRWDAESDQRLIINDLTTLELPDIHPAFDLEVARQAFSNSKYYERTAYWDIGYLGPDTFGLVYELEELFATWNEMLNMEVEEDLSGHSVIDDFDGRYNSNYHLRMYHVIPTFPDPSTVLHAIVAPFGEIGKASEFVEFEEMLKVAGAELDAVKRHQMYIEIETFLAEQALVIPVEVFSGFECYRTHSWVHDFEPPKYLGSTFHDVWLDERAPKRELPLP